MALWKSPTSTLGAVLALALGIGATTTMFGLLNAVALRPLPYPESDRLVELWGNVERQTVERRGTSIPDYLDWRDKSRSFDLMSAWSQNNFIRYGSGAPERVSGEIVGGDYFAILGVEPLLGGTAGLDPLAVGGRCVAGLEPRCSYRVSRRPALTGARSRS